MDGEWGVVGRSHLRLIQGGHAPRLLLVEADLGRRATLSVALATRYAVDVATPAAAAARAATKSFDLAVLDATALGAALPRAVRALRGRSRHPRLVISAPRRDLRARHHAATLGVDAVLFRPTSAAALLDRIESLVAVAEPRPPFDRGVGRAIDLMARDVVHLLDVKALAEATGVPLAPLAERFRAELRVGIAEYALRVRVAVAEQLLRDTELGVSTLAELLGFATADELVRAFSGRPAAQLR